MTAEPTTPHTVKSFDEEIDELRTLVSQMGGFAEAQIATAIDALIRRDGDLGLKVAEDDAELDRLEGEAEAMAVSIIARRAPMADDLRELVAALKISAIIERIGDYAKNIGKRASSMAASVPVQPVAIIPEMGRLAASMLKDALDAYVERDARLAIDVMMRDTSVDDLYNSLFRSLLTYMMENPHHITPSAHLLFIAKNLERIGDHATNIAEMVHFQVTGQHLVERPKADQTPLYTETLPPRS
ncbi:phosphate signaling complex protein PhoU [Thermaurantiacus sp.]